MKKSKRLSIALSSLAAHASEPLKRLATLMTGDSGEAAGAGSQHFALVIFDFDGTLADSFHWFASELNEVARVWDFRAVAAADQTRLRQMSAPALFRELQVARWKRPWIARDLRRRMARDIERIDCFAGVDGMLRQLADSPLRLAIASSNTADNIRRVLGPDLSARIDAFECGIGLGGKQRRLARLCRRLGVSPKRALYIGDEVRDMIAARRAGMAAGAVTWGYNHEQALRARGPDILFHHVAEIPAVLLADASRPG